MTKFYVDEAGNYLGGFDGVLPPSGSVEVMSAPDRADQVWIADENAWSPATIEVPQQVTMRQARLALLGSGLLAQVDPAIESLESPEREAARIEWDYSSSVVRSRPLVVMLGQKLGLDDAALDQLFITAAGL